MIHSFLMRSGKAPDSRARHVAEQKYIVMVNVFYSQGDACKLWTDMIRDYI